jgi:hypothetical protein
LYVLDRRLGGGMGPWEQVAEVSGLPAKVESVEHEDANATGGLTVRGIGLPASARATVCRWARIVAMAPADSRPELASMATTLEEVTHRLAAIAEAAAGDEESRAAELFEIERELRGATRRLAKLVGDLEDRASR